VVDLGGGYVHYYRGLDENTRGREYLAKELISDDERVDASALQQVLCLAMAGIAEVEQMRAAVLSSRVHEHLSKIATVVDVLRGVVGAGHHYSCVVVDDDDLIGNAASGKK
jgi:hypothetical protein